MYRESGKVLRERKKAEGEWYLLSALREMVCLLFCFFGNNSNGSSHVSSSRDHHILFLGWNQGSTEHSRDESVVARQQTIEFIEREFSSEESKNSKWRYCIHHMTRYVCNSYLRVCNVSKANQEEEEE